MQKLTTVKDIALNLDVTRQTVYNHIDKNIEQLKGNIRKIQGITYLTEEGVNIIKESMGLIKIPVENQVVGIEEIMQELKESIKDNIEMSMQNVREDNKKDYEKLELELQEVKKQNEILIQMMKDQAEKKEEKKGLFSIFKRK